MAKQKKLTATGEPVIADEVRKVSSLTVDPRNPKKHPESQVADIAASLERFGYIEKLVIRPNGQLVGGEGRLEAIKRLGWDEIECLVVAGLSETAYSALGLALNKLGENGRYDNDILRDVILGIHEDGENAMSLGFSQAELKGILEEPADLEVKEIETSAVDDEFWISIRGPLAQQANALRALEAAMKPFAGVSVEQGTINIG